MIKYHYIISIDAVALEEKMFENIDRQTAGRTADAWLYYTHTYKP